MNTLLCFLLGSVPFTVLVLNAFPLEEYIFIPLFSVSSWGPFGSSLRTLYRIFVLQATDPDCNHNESLSAILFYFKPISSVTTANISKSLLALTHRRVNRTQERMGFQVLEALFHFLSFKRCLGSYRSRTFHRPKTAHANKQDWVYKPALRNLHGWGKPETAFLQIADWLIRANILHGLNKFWGCAQFFLISITGWINWIITEINCKYTSTKEICL